MGPMRTHRQAPGAAILAACASLALASLARAAIVAETYTDRSAFEARLGGAFAAVDFDDVDTSVVDPAPFAADRYAGSHGIVITGEAGQYASRDFGFPTDYPTSSAPNAYAPGPVEDTLGGGNTTVVSFVASGQSGRVAGFGLVFVDPDLTQVSGLTVFDADEPLGEARVPEADHGTVFRGIVAVDDTTSLPAAVIARVEIDNGTGWPAGTLNDGVPLDDFVFGVPLPADATTSTTTAPGASTTSTTLPPFACGAAPLIGCRKPVASRRSALLVRRSGLAWSWGSGAATAKEDFGDPPAGPGFVFCLHDASGLVLAASVSGGGTCGRRLCWRTTRTGFRYRDPARRADGIALLVLRAGGDGQSRIVLAAAGPALPSPSFPFETPVTAQLVRADGAACWEARMSLARKSTATRFHARSD